MTCIKRSAVLLYTTILISTALNTTGCAHQKAVHVVPAGSTHFYGCREVSVNAKTGEITVICPPQEKK
jgi:hypothetical protein